MTVALDTLIRNWLSYFWLTTDYRVWKSSTTVFHPGQNIPILCDGEAGNSGRHRDLHDSDGYVEINYARLETAWR